MPYLGVRPADITSATEAEVAGDLTVDTNTLKVDAANNRVFVGATSGDRKFEVHDTGVVVANFKSTGANSLMAFDNSSDTSQNHMIGFSGDDFRVVETTEKIRVLSSGGITFNGDTATNNSLSDYEHGSFVPAFATSQTGFSSVTYHTQTGRYVKVGDIVYAYWVISTSALTIGSAAGAIIITGFPYTMQNNNYQAGSVGYSQGWTTNHPTSLLSSPNQTQVFVYHSNGSTTHVNTNVSNMSDHSSSNLHWIYGSLTYRVE